MGQLEILALQVAPVVGDGAPATPGASHLIPVEEG